MRPEDYEILFDLTSGEYDGHGIAGIRTVTIRAGASLEVMCHPIIKRWPDEAKREAKSRKTSKAMELINQRNAMLNIMRLAEINFTHLKAMVFTGTLEYPNADDIGMMNIDDVWKDWRANKLPEDVEDVRKIVRNFLNRIKRRMKNPKELKWILRIEEDEKLAAFGLPNRYHIHMLIEAGELTQNEVADQWQLGFSRCDRFDLHHDGAAKIATYITKNKKGGRWVSHSRNLKKPTQRISDRKISRRRVAKIAEDISFAGRSIFEKIYPGYKVAENIRVSYSDFIQGAYIYCRMRRKD